MEGRNLLVLHIIYKNHSIQGGEVPFEGLSHRRKWIYRESFSGGISPKRNGGSLSPP